MSSLGCVGNSPITAAGLHEEERLDGLAVVGAAAAVAGFLAKLPGATVPVLLATVVVIIATLAQVLFLNALFMTLVAMP